MTSRKVLILGVVAIVVLTLAMLLSHRESSPSGDKSAGALYPTLKSELNSVTTVRLFKTGDTRTVALARQGNEWGVSERNGYPADHTKINRLLVALSEARLVEQKTSNPDSYPALSVEDVSNPTAGGTRVEVAGAPTAVNLIIGKASGMKGSYVRRAGEPASWLVDQTLEAPATANEWLRTSIIDVGADHLQAVTVSTNGNKPYTAQKATRADADFKVDLAVPKGKELDKFAANGFANVLMGLTLSDVHPGSDFTADKPAAHTTVRTFDGLIVDLDGWVKDGKHYIAVKTAYDADQEKRFHVETKAAEKSADATPESAAAKSAADKTDEQAKTLTAQLNGWVYEIADYKYEAIFKPATSLVKDIAPPAKPSANK